MSIQKKLNMLQQYPNITNQYEYYINSDFRSRWEDLNKEKQYHLYKKHLVLNILIERIWRNYF